MIKCDWCDEEIEPSGEFYYLDSQTFHPACACEALGKCRDLMTDDQYMDMFLDVFDEPPEWRDHDDLEELENEIFRKLTTAQYFARFGFSQRRAKYGYKTI